MFVNQVDLPRGRTREYVYSLREPLLLRGSESRALATVGAFRVVPAGDLRDADDRPLDPNRGDLHHLRRQGLVETVPSPGRDRSLVVLTGRDRQLLDRNRPHEPETLPARNGAFVERLHDRACYIGVLQAKRVTRFVQGDCKKMFIG